ncbi:hypothetical protein Trydic_g19624 [Trypoxylus dichotomus]
MRLKQAIQEKRLEWRDGHGKLILQHDNARPNAGQPVRTYLERVKWDVLPHPPYSADRSDYYLFRSMQAILTGENFTSYEQTYKREKREEPPVPLRFIVPDKQRTIKSEGLHLHLPFNRSRIGSVFFVIEMSTDRLQVDVVAFGEVQGDKCGAVHWLGSYTSKGMYVHDLQLGISNIKLHLSIRPS